LGFPFRMSDRSTSTPAFLHAIRPARFRVSGSTTFIADPTGLRRAPLLRRDRAEYNESAKQVR
jgi:hypothetical protein